MKKSILSVLAILLLIPSAWAANYEIDIAHSSITFKVRHLIGKVSGSFGKFKGTYTYEQGNPKAWKVEAEIDVTSIDTNVEKRDKHLRSKDFFYVEKFPTLTFKSSKITKKNPCLLGDTQFGAKLGGRKKFMADENFSRLPG